MRAPGVVSRSVTERFRRWCGRGPDGVWAAPGRVNLIGEHTDYNAGLVLPIAIDRVTAVAAGRRGDGTIRCASSHDPAVVSQPLDALEARGTTSEHGWATYVLGAAWALRSAGVEVVGADLCFDSDLSLGAGLSSSAALEVATLAALAGLSGAVLTPVETATLAWRGENEFVGIPAGTMDQTVVAAARARHALLLDTRSGEQRHIPIAPDREGLVVAVIDTGVHRRLVDGRYAERRRECEEAARTLGVATLRDASLERVEASTDLDETLRRRARHVVTENARVVDVVAALDAGRLGSIGDALVAGHASLRDDYEVSCAELDLAVDTAMASGAVGARMTGAGFGGCAVALLSEDAVTGLSSDLEAAFAARGFALPSTFVVFASAGVRRLA